MDVLLFCYGTLCEEEVQRRLFGRAVEAIPDRLPGYALSTLPAGYLIVDRCANAEPPVDGLVLRLSEAELAIADAYEIEDYARVRATLASGAEAFVYARASRPEGA